MFCISFIYYNNRNHIYVKVDDGKDYRVQITKDSKESANLLANAINKVKILLEHLKKSESQDIRTKTLISRFNPENITENDPHEMKKELLVILLIKVKKLSYV